MTSQCIGRGGSPDDQMKDHQVAQPSSHGMSFAVWRCSCKVVPKRLSLWIGCRGWTSF